jgi:hypothetical protein
MDINGIKSFLWSLASEKNINQSRCNTSVLDLPMPNRKTAKFRVWESGIQEPNLQAKFPEIKPFSAQDIDDPYATIRFDLTYYGFHAQIISAATGKIYIDSYKRGNKDYYISYFNRDNIKNKLAL